jgi:hypothetical protein
MESLITLAGVLLGGLLALLGQYLSQRSSARDRKMDALLDASAVVLALAEDFRNRVWEDRHGLATGAVDAWDLAAARAADARFRLLTSAPEATHLLASRTAVLAARFAPSGRAGRGPLALWRLVVVGGTRVSPGCRRLQCGAGVQQARESQRRLSRSGV